MAMQKLSVVKSAVFINLRPGFLRYSPKYSTAKQKHSVTKQKLLTTGMTGWNLGVSVQGNNSIHTFKPKHFSTRHIFDVKSVCEMRKELEEQFTEKDISEPKESAEYLIAHVIGEKTLHAVHPTELLSPEQLEKLSLLVDRRLKKVPIQYILGEWDFRELTLTVAPPVLIPRPETEELAGLIIEREDNVDDGRFLEVGPGAGPICLSLLNAFPKLKCLAVDKSREACDLTRHNSQTLGLHDRIQIINSPLQRYNFSSTEKFNFIVSNPPYVATHLVDVLDPEVKDYEDHGALDGGEDGLDIVKLILHIAPSILNQDGSIWLEVDGQHPQQIKDYISRDPVLKDELVFIHCYQDFNKISRFCHIRRR